MPAVEFQGGMADKRSLFWKGRNARISPFPPRTVQHSFPGDTADAVFPPTGCVAVVSVIEQLAQVHNSTVQASMERLCSYLPGKDGKDRVGGAGGELPLFLAHESP